MAYKWCVVPRCTNNSSKTPQKLFVSIPINPKRRKQWLQLARRDPNSIAPRSNVFMCEDHFDMEKDTMNYMKFKMGFCGKILWTDTAVPKKFHCQEDSKKEGTDLLEGYEEGSHPSSEQKIVSTFEGDVDMTQEIFEPVAATEPDSTPAMDLLGIHVKSELDIVKLENEELITKGDAAAMDLLGIHVKNELENVKIENEELIIEEDAAMGLLGIRVKSELLDVKLESEELIIKEEDADMEANALLSADKEDTIQLRKLFPRQLQVIERDQLKIEFLKCLSCDFKCKLKATMIGHQRSHADPSKIEIHRCSKCDFVTKSKSYLKTHQLQHSSKLKMFMRSNGDYETEYKGYLINTTPLKIETFRCFKCNFRTKYKGHLKEHLLMHADVRKVKLFGCSKCNYQTKYRRNIRSHMSTHVDSLKTHIFKCSKCNHESKYKSAMKQHQLVHADPSEVPMYSCSKCDFETKHRGNLRTHLSNHADVSEIDMSTCSKAYESEYKSFLQKNQSIQVNPSKVSTHRCSKCNFETKHGRSLRRHQLIHDDPSTTSMYRCSKCNFRTKYRDNLRKHLSIHADTSKIDMFKRSRRDCESSQDGDHTYSRSPSCEP